MLKVGPTLPLQIEADLAAEALAIQHYTNAIRVCISETDDGTRELLEHNLREEEEHHNYLEGQRTQIQQMGLANWLANQA